jgi:hypothetical protein
MLNHAALANLEQALRDRTVLSVYVNGEVTDVAARSQWRTALRNALDDIEKSLAAAAHSDREEFAAARALAEGELNAFTPGNGAPGWMGLIGASEIHHAGVVPVPVPTQATWSKGANLGPGIRVLKESRPVFLVLADSAQVRIHRYVDRSLTLADSFERDANVDQPYHMSRPAPQGFGSGTRGRPGAEAAQREQRKATDVMLAAAVKRVEELAGEDGWVLVGGIPVVAADLHGRLGQRVSERSSVVPIDIHTSEAGLAESAREHASRLRAADDLSRIERVVSAKASGGTGAVGSKDIERALVNGQVHELYLTSSFVNEHSDKAVDVIRKAFDEGAIIEHVSGEAAEKLDSIGGIAAKLRFTIDSAGSTTINP